MPHKLLSHDCSVLRPTSASFLAQTCIQISTGLKGHNLLPQVASHVVITRTHKHMHSRCHVHAHADSRSLTHKHSHDGQGLLHAVSLRSAHPSGSLWFRPPLRWNPWTLSLWGPPPHPLPYSVIPLVRPLLLPISSSPHGTHERGNLFNPLTLEPGVAGGPQRGASQ